MHKIQTMLILALLMVPAVSRAQYDTYIWKADSLYMFGEFAQSSAMFDKAFQTGQPVEGRHLYNAARGDVAPSQVAMMEDRINMFEGKPQKYGSQIEEGAYGARVVYTLLDPEMVDVWRKEVGLEPLADYLRNMGAGMPVSAEVLSAQRELLQQGDSCMQQYNTFEALKYYQQAFEQADTYEARTKLGDCYYKRGNYRQTSELLKLVPEDSLSHDAFRQLANSYQKQDDTDSYIYWTEQLVNHYPMDGEMVAGLTLAYTKNQQPQIGIICGLKYCQKDSTNILVNRALADALFMDRNFAAAAELYERLMEQGDSTFNTLYSAGMSYSRLDSLELAYKYLQLAFLVSGMQHESCAYRLGVVCIDTKRYPEGLRCLEFAKQMMLPDTVVMKAITLSQGEGYYLTQHYEEAVAAWKEHLTYNPSSIATYFNIANAYAYIFKDSEQAKAYYQQFLDLARKEENPTDQLKEMLEKAAEMLEYYNK